MCREKEFLIKLIYFNGSYKCGKGDLNSRTPTRMDSKSTALDQTWQFPLFNILLLIVIDIKCWKIKKHFSSQFNLKYD